MVRSLVVDDDNTCSYIYQTQLSKLGVCDAVGEGYKAVSDYESSINRGEPYELLVIDIMMPEMSGFDVLHQIRLLEDSRGMSFPDCAKVIMTTGLDDDENRKLESQLNPLCEAYLPKTSDTKALYEKLDFFGFDISQVL